MSDALGGHAMAEHSWQKISRCKEEELVAEKRKDW
jgi:hypothetical protein